MVWEWVGLGRTEKDSQDEADGVVMCEDMARAALNEDRKRLPELLLCVVWYHCYCSRST